MSLNCVPPKVLYSTLGGDPDLGEIVELFVDEIPDRVANIQNLLEASDWEELRRAAHQLKGAAGSYGFDPISPSAAAIEDAICQEEPEEQIRQMVEDLCSLCSRVRAGTPDV